MVLVECVHVEYGSVIVFVLSVRPSGDRPISTRPTLMFRVFHPTPSSKYPAPKELPHCLSKDVSNLPTHCCFVTVRNHSVKLPSTNLVRNLPLRTYRPHQFHLRQQIQLLSKHSQIVVSLSSMCRGCGEVLLWVRGIRETECGVRGSGDGVLLF